MPPALAVLLITVVIAFFTEFASNTATIIIFLPVLAELVRVLGRESGVGRVTSEICPLPRELHPSYRGLCSLPKCMQVSDPDSFFFFKKGSE